jgi:hypothetical protein
MKRTRASSLLGLGVAGVVVGFLIDTAAAGMGNPTLVPPVSLPLTLVIIAVLVILFAYPIRQATRGKSKSRIDPFRAMRIAVLAKACSLAGAVLTGGGAGILIYMLTRSVIPAPSSVLLAVAAFVAAAVLMVCGLVAEKMCTLPPDRHDDDKQTERSRA